MHGRRLSQPETEMRHRARASGGYAAVHHAENGCAPHLHVLHPDGSLGPPMPESKQDFARRRAEASR